jgi:hypothetical protein
MCKLVLEVRRTPRSHHRTGSPERQSDDGERERAVCLLSW